MPTVYIVSGTDCFIVREIVDNSPLNIPPRQIIGSDETLVAPNQGETDGLNYVFDENDQLVLGGDFLIKNLKQILYDQIIFGSIVSVDFCNLYP